MLEQTDPTGERPIVAVSGRRVPDLARAGAPDQPLGGDPDHARRLGDPALPGLGSPRLSHELRTPLNAILGNAELLLDGSAGPLSSEARACLGDIQVAGQRMLRQVEVLLDLCHARTRPAIAGDRPLDLIELLRAAQSAAPRIGPREAVQVVPAGARCIVSGDPDWLGRLAVVLVELHCPDGPAGDPLLVTVAQCSPPAATATLRVSWRDFHPDQVAALPIALIDAILDLHGGVVALTGHGIQLGWPALRVIEVGPFAAGRMRDRNGL